MNTLSASTGFRGLLATAIFGALASSFSTVCAADASNAPLSETVKFADLNASDSRDAVVLYHRIRAAAEDLCSYYWFKSDTDRDRCMNGAIANAVTHINKAALFAAYNSKNKRTPLPTNLLSQSR